MDDQLRKLKAYRRTKEREQQTFQQLQQQVARQKKNERLKLFSTYVSAAALLFILIASFVSNPSSTFKTASGGKKIKAVEYLTLEPTPWYNLHRQNLKAEGVEIITDYYNRIQVQDTSTTIDWENYASNLFYLMIFEDGTSDRLNFIHPIDQESNIIYVGTQNLDNLIMITKDEYLQNLNYITVNTEKSLPELALRLVGLLFVFVIYMSIVKRINPHLRTPYFYAPSFLKFLKQFILFCAYIYGIFVVSSISSGFPNLLLAWILFALLAVFRAAAENFSGDDHRSWWEVPVTTVVGCVAFCIMFM